MDHFIIDFLEDNGYLKESYEHYASAEEVAKAMKSMREHILKTVADTLWSKDIEVHHVDKHGLVTFPNMKRKEYLEYLKNIS